MIHAGRLPTVAGLLAAGAAALLLARSLRFKQFLAAEQRAVRAAAAAPAEQQTLEELTRGLPPPVQRFFKRCMSGDCLGFKLWVAGGVGGLRFDRGGAWKALRAQTVAAAGPEPSFCYTGCVQLGLGPLLGCSGREMLLRGRGAMEWRLWGAVPLARSQGPHLDQSALLRWLGEAVCFPPALLPSPLLRWLPAAEGEGGGPDRSARAVLTCRGITVTAVFTFDQEGRFLELLSNDFWRVQLDGSVVQAPWRARAVGGHTSFSLGGGASVECPADVEAAWVEPDGTELAYVRFTLDSLRAE